MSDHGEKDVTRRKFMKESAAAAGVAGVAVAGLSVDSARAQEYMILGPDGLDMDLRKNTNVTFENRQIKTFYGIDRDDVLRLPDHGHPTLGEPDPYEGYTDKLGTSCCNTFDCGPAIVNRIGERDVVVEGKTEKENIYAFGMKIFGRPRFAITVPSTKVYFDVTMPGGYPDHGCILNSKPLCLFLRPGL
ncbi:MAG: twin-arginine translocation signal domain-containing protein [bacterium]|nr:twin-arginine translocation signal domain-containing protein [bacterium]